MRRRTGGGKCFFDLCKRGGWVMLEQFGSFDHHPVLAEAALRYLLIDPGLLHRMQGFRRLLCGKASWPGPAGGKTLQRGDLFHAYCGKPRDAGAPFLALEQDTNASTARKCAPASRRLPQ